MLDDGRTERDLSVAGEARLVAVPHRQDRRRMHRHYVPVCLNRSAGRPASMTQGSDIGRSTTIARRFVEQSRGSSVAALLLRYVDRKPEEWTCSLFTCS